MIPIAIGYDPREACVFHVCSQSIIENASQPVSFIPIAQNLLHVDGQRDGTNQFIYSRYLVPHLMGFEGWALWMDGDMHLTADVAELWDLRDDSKAVMVVKHKYLTNHHRKYIGTPLENDNVDYDRKNWSSVVLFNCGHPSNAILTPEFVGRATGKLLHRFEWLNDDEIGDLPVEWNHLVLEYDENPDAKLYHHTLGSPGFEVYHNCESSMTWHRYLLNALNMEGERQAEMVRRAHWNAAALRRAS